MRTHLFVIEPVVRLSKVVEYLEIGLVVKVSRSLSVLNQVKEFLEDLIKEELAIISPKIVKSEHY